jgi:hypothetical protein
MSVEHLVSQNLKGEWNEFRQLDDMRIFVVQQGEDLLCEVFGMVSRHVMSRRRRSFHGET